MITEHGDQYWMYQALQLAMRAQEEGEIPVGALLILDNQVIGEGWNQTISHHDPTAHAEIIALRQGGKILKNYRLINATLYVTLEPCIMCSGAIVHSRLSRLVYGTKDKNTSAAGSWMDILCHPRLNHHVSILSGILAEECSSILNNFFYFKRKQKKENKVNSITR